MRTDENKVQSERAEDDNQLELFPHSLLQQMIAVERERIDSANKRTDVARLAIERNDTADQRQYEYQMARLQSEDTDKQRRHRLASQLLIGLGSFSGLAIVFLLTMAFFGGAEQQEMALNILIILAIAVGGYGVIGGIIAGVRKAIGS